MAVRTAVVAPPILPESTRSPVSLTISLLAGAGFLVVGIGIGWWMRNAFQTEEAEPVMQSVAQLEDPLGARSDLAEEVGDVHDLYLEMGYSPMVVVEIARIRRELRDQVTVEIPDYESFLEALVQARNKMKELEATSDFEQKSSASVRRNALLLDEVWERRDQPSAVRDRLNADTIGGQLPFIEHVPVTRDGSVRWRTPARVGVLYKQPNDVKEYNRLLDRLSSLTDHSGLSRSDAAVDEVKAAIERLRDALQVVDAYVPAPLQRVEEAIEDWYEGGHSSAQQARREELDTFLLDLLALQRACARLLDEVRRPGKELYEDVRVQATQQAQQYLETLWMHRVWLADSVLANLMTAEVLRVRRDSEVSPPFHQHLETVAQEIRSRGYDPAETIHRLRVYESEGYFVHSLVFSLLRKRADVEPAGPLEVGDHLE